MHQSADVPKVRSSLDTSVVLGIGILHHITSSRSPIIEQRKAPARSLEQRFASRFHIVTALGRRWRHIADQTLCVDGVAILVESRQLRKFIVVTVILVFGCIV
jgi:hypothetical protein